MVVAWGFGVREIGICCSTAIKSQLCKIIKICNSAIQYCNNTILYSLKCLGARFHVKCSYHNNNKYWEKLKAYQLVNG